MKKSILILATAFTFSAFFTSCRETANDRNDVEVSDDIDNLEDGMEDAADNVEDAAEDVGNSIEEGANEVEDELEGNDEL